MPSRFPSSFSAGSSRLHLAMAAYLSRYKMQSRVYAESDLRSYLTWCLQRGVDPFEISRPQVELYVRWMQEIRRFKPSTVSRRLSIVTGFYRTCVIYGDLPSSPAEHVRRPNVPAESRTLGLTHLQFEAMLAAGRLSPDPNDFALVAMLGILGLRILNPPGRPSATSARNTTPPAAGHRQRRQGRPDPPPSCRRSSQRPRSRTATAHPLCVSTRCGPGVTGRIWRHRA